MTARFGIAEDHKSSPRVQYLCLAARLPCFGAVQCFANEHQAAASLWLRMLHVELTTAEACFVANRIVHWHRSHGCGDGKCSYTFGGFVSGSQRGKG